jgi:septum formation protein
MRLLLASGSATRRRMLEAAGIPFDWGSPGADEEKAKQRLVAVGAGAAAIAQHLAELKALSLPGRPDDLVLGSDQVLEQADGTMLSKAGSRSEASEQLRALSGKEHRLHSAASLVQQGQAVWRGMETATLRMRPLSEQFIETYLEQEWEEVGGSVGVYRIEGPGVQLFEKVEGSHWAILGMPLLPLLEELRGHGIMAS